jgi:DNA (cytosine-5)-methyltransferase 1
LTQEIQPKFIFLENVPAITTRGGVQVVQSLAEIGYDCRWCTLCASQFGAPHKRERWFLLAYSRSESKRSEKESKRSSLHTPGCGRFWEVEPSLDRVVDGIPRRMDRVKALGNAVVPIQAKEAFKYLMGLNNEK